MLLLVGVGLRWHALIHDVRFHPDEALFSTFARSAAVKGDWLLPGALDKPPLAIYANALSQVLVGQSEFAARLPGTLASILLMALIYALAKSLYPAKEGQNIASVPNLALLLMACSPFAIAFSATALTDGLMLTCMVAALWLVMRGNWGGSGLWLGLAFASKTQGLFYLPLILLLGYFSAAMHSRKSSLITLLRFAAGFGSVVLMLLLWDSARPEVSIFTLATINNDPGRLIRANEILPRLTAWVGYVSQMLGDGWLTALLLSIAGIGVLYRLVRQARQPQTIVDVLLCAYLLGYGWLHWLVAFNTYDRYLLPILPVLILLAARGLNMLVCWLTSSFAKALLMIFLGAALLLGGFQASRGGFVINQEGELYRGIDQVADYLNQQPVATVIYDHWLGWELDYYLGVWHDKRRVYYPTPRALVVDALQLCEIGTRYFVAPIREAHYVWLEALEQAGFEVSVALETSGFRVYGLIPPWSQPGHSVPCSGAPP